MHLEKKTCIYVHSRSEGGGIFQISGNLELVAADPDAGGLPVNVLGADLLDIGDTSVGSVVEKLVPEQLGGPSDTLSSVDVGEHERPANTDGLYAERKELQDISAVADTTISIDLDLVED